MSNFLSAKSGQEQLMTCLTHTFHSLAEDLFSELERSYESDPVDHDSWLESVVASCEVVSILRKLSFLESEEREFPISPIGAWDDANKQVAIDAFQHMRDSINQLTKNDVVSNSMIEALLWDTYTQWDENLLDAENKQRLSDCAEGFLVQLKMELLKLEAWDFQGNVSDTLELKSAKG